ncbi:hypothetical protein K438DRAFT_1969276 [Mycena galopus ATCC 62051]|nr:hypothetical protein K438DRAFT_1969276 [Mycena galopus ATCC 62051]
MSCRAKPKKASVSTVNVHTATFSIADITGDNTETPIMTIVQCASDNNREEILVVPPSPVKCHRAGLVQPAPECISIDNEDVFETDCYQMGFDLLDDMPPERVQPAIPRVAKPSDCFGDKLFCASCLVAGHVKNPLHRIERWNGRFFEPSMLKALGLRVQLGHIPGQRCSEPLQLHTQFVVLHTNGIHEVAVDSCDCEHRGAGAPEEQLQRVGWFPATDDRPRTCATMELLDTFIAQTYQAKTTMYDYYSVLEKLTNNAGVKPPNRYHAFLCVVRKYSHLLMLKRAGHGHAKTGVMGTEQGELAVKCPCCPQPGVNLPAGWENAPPQDKFLYILFIAIDACFRLKRRLVSSELKDPTLGPDSGTGVKEMSTCSGLAVLDHTNTKFSRGYSATGVGMGKGERFGNMDWIFLSILSHLHPRLRKIISYDIACQWWKNLKSRVKTMPPRICLKIVLALMRFVVPKMHIKGHDHNCQTEYSLDYVPGSAQTDGEGIECPWAHIGGVGSSTKEMGPGSREDTLNGHWGSWNWQKLLGLGEALQTKLDRAKSEAAAQLEVFTQFSTQQAVHVPAWKAMVETFERNPEAKNPYRMMSKGITEAKMVLQFKQEEAEQPRDWKWKTSSDDLAEGAEPEHSASVHPPGDVYAGFHLSSGPVRERSPDKQLENVPLFLPSALTAAQRTAETVKPLVAMENMLRDAQCGTALECLRLFLHVKSRLLTYKQLQARHQGANICVRTLVERNKCKICLYSEKYQMAWEARWCLADGDMEKVGWRILRKEDIRCMEDAEELARNADKWRVQQERRCQREDNLCRNGELPPLGEEERAQRERMEDIRCMEDAEELARNADKWRVQQERRCQREDNLCRDGELPPLGEEERAQRERGGENVREVSWIWTGAVLAGTDAQLEEVLQIEWCKAYARTRRWQEEVWLVEEEVRRAGVTLEARACTWEERAKGVPVGVMEWAEWDAAGVGRWAVERAEGAIAYAVKQAAIFRGIASRLVVSMAEGKEGA